MAKIPHRRKIPPKKSRARFSRSAGRTHIKNVDSRPMRGGIRL